MFRIRTSPAVIRYRTVRLECNLSVFPSCRLLAKLHPDVVSLFHYLHSIQPLFIVLTEYRSTLCTMYGYTVYSPDCLTDSSPRNANHAVLWRCMGKSHNPCSGLISPFHRPRLAHPSRGVRAPRCISVRQLIPSLARGRLTFEYSRTA